MKQSHIMRSRMLIIFMFFASAFCQAEITFLHTRQESDINYGAALKARDENVIDCKFVGNADFYGIGVRIGFYLLWLSGFLDFTFNPDSSVAIGDAQTIFDFANLIALIVLNNQQPPISDTTSKDRKPVFVPILLLYMFFGGAIVSATTTANFPKAWLTGDKAKRFSTAIRQFFVHSTFIAMMGYALYFFVRGYKNFDLVAPCKIPEVGPRLFPLADPVSFTDSPIVGLILLPLIMILYILVLYVAVQRYNDLKGTPSQKKMSSWIRPTMYHKIQDWLRSSERQLSWTILGAVIMFVSIVWSITAIEWTIDKNEIQGLNDVTVTGQLIPLIIGAFSLPTTAWSIYKSHREEKRTDNEQKEESEFDTPLKHLTFADAGLESPNGVYIAIQPRHEHNLEDRPPSSQELRETRTF